MTTHNDLHAGLGHLENICNYLEHDGNTNISLPFRIVRLLIKQIRDDEVALKNIRHFLSESPM